MPAKYSTTKLGLQTVPITFYIKLEGQAPRFKLDVEGIDTVELSQLCA